MYKIQDLDSAIRSGYYLKGGLSNNEDFFYMSLLLTITADNVEDLELSLIHISAGRAAGAGGLAGGLAGMISRQAVSKTAEQATTESASGGIMAGIGSKLYDNSLGEKDGFAQEVISSVATGDGGVMSGDKAVDAFNAYMGNSANSKEVQASVSQLQTQQAQSVLTQQSQIQQDVESRQNISTGQENNSQQEITNTSSAAASEQMIEDTAGDIPYQATDSAVSYTHLLQGKLTGSLRLWVAKALEQSVTLDI